MNIRLIFFMVLAMTATTSFASSNSLILALCLNSPNCVSSQAKRSDKEHYIKPFRITGTTAAAWLALKKAITSQSRTVITHETSKTLHYEAISLVFSFVDDVDMVLDKNENVIHVRSASRIGHSDFGVNRKRIETLRKELQQAGVIE